ncbi:MAG: AI-2E family transporter [bacterium]|nr:AI-2E family transporter [bacterium]
MDRNISITITSGTIIKAIAVIFLFFILYVVRDLVLVVLTATLIASAIEPMALFLRRRGLSRLLSVLLIYASCAGIFVGLFYSFVPTFLKETSGLISEVPRYIDSVSLWDPLGLSSDSLEGERQFAEGLSRGIVESEIAVRSFSGALSIREVVSTLSRAISNVSEGFVQTVSVIFGGILSFILIIVLSFYLAVQENGIAKFLQVVTPRNHEKYVIGLWQRVQLKIGYWLQGQLLLAVLVGVLVYLGLTILGVRNAMFFGVLAGIFEIIPLFGPILAAIPAVAVAYIDGGVSLALLAVGLYLIIQQFENHLIYPLVVRKIIGVPPIIVIIALIVGAKLAGFLGLILSVPLAATLMELFEDAEKKKAKEIPEMVK